MYQKRWGIIAGVILTMIAVFAFVICPEFLLITGSALALVPIFGSVADGTFKTLTVEEIEKLEVSEQVNYFNELNIHKAKELEAFKTKMKTDSSKELETKINELKAEINKDNLEQLKVLQKAIEDQGIAIRKMSISNGSKQIKSIEDELYAVKDHLLNAANKTVVIKTDVTRASITDNTISMRLPDVGQLATQANRLAPLFATGTISEGMGGVVRYIDQSTVTNNAAAVLENNSKPESAITWTEYTMALQKVAHNIPVTMEALSDIPFMASEINNMLLKYLDVKVDGYLWSGTGTAPQIWGVYARADTYTAAAAGITDASIFDLLVKVHEDIAGATAYMPNYAIMNIADVNKMRLKKDGNNNYVLPPFVSADGNQVAGMTIIASNSVTANTMLVGDFSYATLYRLGGMTLEVGRIANQFIENQVTVQAEVRLGMLIRNAHTDAFRKVTSISAALVTLAS